MNERLQSSQGAIDFVNRLEQVNEAVEVYIDDILERISTNGNVTTEQAKALAMLANELGALSLHRDDSLQDYGEIDMRIVEHLQTASLDERYKVIYDVLEGTAKGEQG